MNQSKLMLAGISGLSEWVDVTLVSTWDYWATCSWIWSASMEVWSTKSRVVMMIQRLTLLDMLLEINRVTVGVGTLVLTSSDGTCMSRALVLWAMSRVFNRVVMCFAIVDTLAVAVRVRMRMLWCYSGVKCWRGGVAQRPLWRWICIVLSISLDWIIHEVILNALQWYLVTIVLVGLWRIDLNIA